MSDTCGCDLQDNSNGLQQWLDFCATRLSRDLPKIAMRKSPVLRIWTFEETCSGMWPGFVGMYPLETGVFVADTGMASNVQPH